MTSPYQLVEQAENRADRWAYENSLTPEGFRSAFKAGCREVWELAEWFGMPEEQIEKALHYWTECRDVEILQE